MARGKKSGAGGWIIGLVVLAAAAVIVVLFLRGEKEHRQPAQPAAQDERPTVEPPTSPELTTEKPTTEPLVAKAPEPERTVMKPPFPFVTHFDLVPIAGLPKPDKGQSVTEPVFGLEIFRVSDCLAEAPPPNPHRAMVPNYPTFSHENCDGTFVLVQGRNPGGRFHLYDAVTFEYVKGLEVRGDVSPHWDPENPRILYYSGQYSGGMEFVSYDVTTDERTVIRDFKKDFPDAMRLFMPAYAEPSADKRYWGFLIFRYAHDEHGSAKAATNVMAAIVYDRFEDRIVSRTTKGLGRNVYVSPSGERVLMTDNKGFFGTWGQDKAAAKAREAFSYKLDFSDPVSLGTGQGHSDIAIDVNGNEVKVYQAQETDFITMVDLRTGRKTELLSVVHETTWEALTRGGSGLHISGSCLGTPGWVVVSQYGGDGKNAYAWQNSAIYLLELKENPRVLRLVHCRTTRGGNAGSPKAWINASGTRICWGSDWADPDGTADTYRIDLPDGWYEQVMGRDKARELRARVK